MLKKISLLFFIIILGSGWLGLWLTPEPEAEVKTVVVEKIVEVEIEVRVPVAEYEVYEITAYTAGYESTGKHPNHPEYGITASGARVKPYYTLACPRHIPFGTKIYIAELDWIYTCEDRGSAITAGHLDIYIEDLAQALQFGRQKMHILILPRSDWK